MLFLDHRPFRSRRLLCCLAPWLAGCPLFIIVPRWSRRREYINANRIVHAITAEASSRSSSSSRSSTTRASGGAIHSAAHGGMNMKERTFLALGPNNVSVANNNNNTGDICGEILQRPSGMYLRCSSGSFWWYYYWLGSIKVLVLFWWITPAPPLLFHFIPGAMKTYL